MNHTSLKITSAGDDFAFSQTVSFEKMFDWTTLRVQWRGTLRGGYGHNWGRWKILFGGSDCGNPGWIESLNYNEESNTDHMKASGSTLRNIVRDAQ